MRSAITWVLAAVLLSAGVALSVSALRSPDPGSPAAAPSTTVDNGSSVPITSQASSTTRSEPTLTTVPMGPVTVVGESLTLSAAPELEERLDDVTIDAEVGRSYANDLAALEGIVERGEVGRVVVVHVGNNDPVPDDGFDRILELVGDRRLIVMTVSHPREWESHVNDLIDEFALARPQVEVIDWKQETERHPELLAGDRVHLSPAGIDRYAELVAETVTAP